MGLWGSSQASEELQGLSDHSWKVIQFVLEILWNLKGLELLEGFRLKPYSEKTMSFLCLYKKPNLSRLKLPTDLYSMEHTFTPCFIFIQYLPSLDRNLVLSN